MKIRIKLDCNACAGKGSDGYHKCQFCNGKGEVKEWISIDELKKLLK